MMEKISEMTFAEIAVAEGLITQEQLEQAMEIQKHKPDWCISEILAFLGHIDDAEIKSILQIQRAEKALLQDNQSMTGTELLVENITIARPVERETAQFLPPATVSPNTRYLGRYQILAEIGRGGMGRVYKAYDAQLDRMVALKVLISGDAASKKENERFLREAKATAKLRHPNIVTIYGINNEKGQIFFTMDFIEGLSFKDFLHKYSPTTRQIIEIMIKVGDAVHYAHTQDIIHRDIKPSNIMINEKKEPKVMDFGLAKMASVSDSLSKTGDVLGTPAYMSPEQAASKSVDSTSDVYSLGTTLYEALTDRPPFQGESYLDVLYKIVHCEPIPPRTVNPNIPVDLEAICLKCLEKNPEKRYSSAQIFVNDLKNFLYQRPIMAKPTTFTNVKKFLLRHHIVQIVSILAVLGSVSFVILFSHSHWQRVEKEREIHRQQAEKFRVEAQQAKLRLSKIALDRAKEAQKNGLWREGGALAGAGLEMLGECTSPEAKKLWQIGTSLIYKAMQQQGIAANRDLDELLLLQPRRTTQKLFATEVTVTFSTRPWKGDEN